MELALQTPSQKMDQIMVRVRPLLRTVLFVLAVLAMGTMLAMFAEAAQTTAKEFDASATKVEAWIKGNLGKTIVMGGLIFSLAAFAWTRDFKLLFLPLIAAVVIGVVIGIINSSFTAVI
ncbi:hypothetical protein PX669_19675 (plasmid) [Acinetobacter soli]|nr:hypothetical protein PX669_19675 [Acinetobacter soli]